MTRFQSREIKQVANDAIKPCRRFFHFAGERVLSRGKWASLWKSTHRRGNCRQRRAQFVRDRVQQGLAKPLGFSQQFGLRFGLPKPLSVENQGDLINDTVEKVSLLKRESMAAWA